MKLPALLVSDPHYTAAPADSYRWGLFPWLHAQIKIYRIRTLCILGDLTDAKDQHPAELVNRLVKELASIAKLVDEVIVLMGNHDYLKGGHAFFQFLEVLPNVKFISQGLHEVSGDALCAFIPHSKNPAKDWAGYDLSHFNLVFMHQTISGAIASNGQKMDGEALPDLKTAGKIYSGDIHVPQKLGPIEYVGSPYHVHFGDSFKPRCVVIDKKLNALDIHFETISRVTLRVNSLRELKRTKAKAGDQIKLIVRLDETDKHDWSRIRREASNWLKDQKVEVQGIELEINKAARRLNDSEGVNTTASSISASGAVLRFVEAEELGGEVLSTGLGIVE